MKMREEEEDFDPEKDLFNKYHSLPKEVLEILDRYNANWGDSYEECRAMQKDLETVGYTFDWYLDAVPYNLRQIKTSLVRRLFDKFQNSLQFIKSKILDYRHRLSFLRTIFIFK